MSSPARFFTVVKVITGLFGSISLGISTAFLFQKPMDFFQISVVYSLILGTSLVLEYPSGNLADRFGRKRIYALGVLATALQYAGYAAFSAVPLLYVAAICGGIGDAFISGSLEAWLMGEEAKRTPDPQLHQVFGLSRSLSSLFSVVVSLAIGMLLKTNLSWIYWTGAAIFVGVSLAALLLLPDNRGEGTASWDITVGTLKQFLASPVMIFLALTLAAAFACYSVFILYWQPRAQQFQITSAQLPLVNVAYLMAVAISGLIFARWARKLGSGRILFGAFGATTLSFALMAGTDSLTMLVIALFLYGIGFGSVVPLFFSWAAEVIPPNLRASMLSLMNAVASLTAVLVTLAIGKVIAVWGLATAAQIGLGLGAAILLLLVLIRPMARVWGVRQSVSAELQKAG